MQPRPDNETEVIDLSQFDDDFERAETQPRAEGTQEDLPDGFYDTLVESVNLRRTRNTGNPMIIYRLRVIGPSCEGRSIAKVRVITPKTVSFVKDDFRRLGLPFQRLSEFQQNPDAAVNHQIRIYKRTNAARQWNDVSFVDSNRREDAATPADNGWFNGTEDDLPF